MQSDDAKTVRNALALFRSVHQSGESWSRYCDEAFVHAKHALERMDAALRAAEADTARLREDAEYALDALEVHEAALRHVEACGAEDGPCQPEQGWYCDEGEALFIDADNRRRAALDAPRKEAGDE
jgi:hypothetical protein